MRSLRTGEEVVDPEGRPLGALERLVVDEQGHRVTHVVVRGRLVGVGHLREADGGRLAADLDGDGLRRQPEARPELVSEPGGHWRAPGGYSLRDFLRIASALVGQEAYVPPVHLDIDLSAVHEIAPDSPVFSGSDQVGEVHEVVADESGQVSALVLRLPGIPARRVLLPSVHVTEVVGTAVHVDLGESEIEALPDYLDAG